MTFGEIGQLIDSLKLKAGKIQKETIDHVTIAVCPKSRYLAISSCSGFPKGTLKKSSITILKVKTTNLEFFTSLKVFNDVEYTNLYSLHFYPMYLNEQPVLYAAESGGNYAISSFTLEE